MSEIEVPQRQQIDKDTPINLRDVVVGEIDGVKLIQFGERFFGNIDDLENWMDHILTRETIGRQTDRKEGNLTTWYICVIKAQKADP